MDSSDYEEEDSDSIIHPVQKQLNKLASCHHKKEDNAYKKADFRYDPDSALTIDQIKEIQATTSLPVYVMIDQTAHHFRYGCEIFHERIRIYSLEADVITSYPYLVKFPNWKNIFKQVNDTVYSLKHEDLEWLERKNKDFIQKQRML